MSEPRQSPIVRVHATSKTPRRTTRAHNHTHRAFDHHHAGSLPPHANTCACSNGRLPLPLLSHHVLACDRVPVALPRNARPHRSGLLMERSSQHAQLNASTWVLRSPDPVPRVAQCCPCTTARGRRSSERRELRNTGFRSRAPTLNIGAWGSRRSIDTTLEYARKTRVSVVVRVANLFPSTVGLKSRRGALSMAVGISFAAPGPVAGRQKCDGSGRGHGWLARGTSHCAHILHLLQHWCIDHDEAWRYWHAR